MTYESGEEIKLSHSWNEQKDYTIRVKAKNEYGSESDWTTLEISMPKNKPCNSTPFLGFLEQHPYMFPLLRQLLEL